MEQRPWEANSSLVSQEISHILLGSLWQGLQELACSMLSLSQLTCTPTKFNLYLANSLATLLNDYDLYRLLMFHMPHLLSLYYCFCHIKGSVEVWRICEWFITYKVTDEAHSSFNCNYNIFMGELVCFPSNPCIRASWW